MMFKSPVQSRAVNPAEVGRLDEGGLAVEQFADQLAVDLTHGRYLLQRA